MKYNLLLLHLILMLLLGITNLVFFTIEFFVVTKCRQVAKIVHVISK